PSNGTVNMTNAAPDVGFSVGLDRLNKKATPKINYTLFNAVTQKYYTLSGAAVSPVGGLPPAIANVSVPLTEADGDSTFFFNWTLGGVLPPGNYYVNASAWDGQTGAAIGAAASAHFGVQDQAPQVLVDVTPPYSDWPTKATLDSAGTTYAPRVFNVTTPYADPATYRIALRDFRDETPLQSVALFQVALPASARDAAAFLLQFNASTDSAALFGDAANGTSTRIVHLDASPPVPSVLLADTQATAAHFGGASDELRIIGVSQDASSGTSKVEVNLYDVTHDKTIVWDADPNGAWGAGDVASYMTSDLVHPGNGIGGVISNLTVRNVWVQHLARQGGVD